MDAIIKVSDGVMVARGDLGVEVGDARLVGIQKRIIQHARTHNKLVITATQMMESMISSPMPTRAEVSRSEEHTSELQSLMRSSYAVFCLKKKIHQDITTKETIKETKQ